MARPETNTAPEVAVIRIGAVRVLSDKGQFLVCNPGEDMYQADVRSATEVFIGAGGWQTILGNRQRNELLRMNAFFLFKFQMSNLNPVFAHFFKFR